MATNTAKDYTLLLLFAFLPSTCSLRTCFFVACCCSWMLCFSFSVTRLLCFTITKLFLLLVRRAAALQLHLELRAALDCLATAFLPSHSPPNFTSIESFRFLWYPNRSDASTTEGCSLLATSMSESSSSSESSSFLPCSTL